MSFGICNNTYEWFKSYLADRVQCVGWKGELSVPNPVTIGVPQGSILGPLFFILFVNDYPKCLKYCNTTIYADDTSTDVCDKSIDVIEFKLTQDLYNSIQWMNQNKLTMNLKKTQCMVIGTSQRLSKVNNICIKIDDVTLENVKDAKLLGVTIDQSLTWSTHLNLLGKKISKKLGVLRRLRCFMSNDALLKVYNSIIFPHFNYCCTVWCSSKNKSNMDCIFKLQKSAARIILNVHDFRTPSNEMFSLLRWMPISDYFIFRKLILIFKVLHNLTPSYMNVFRYISTVSTRNTRGSSDNLLYVPSCRTEYYKRSFTFSGTRLWNELPKEIRECLTLSSFKTSYLNRYFNSQN